MAIIGGGVVGLCTAWHLRRAGWDVTVLDSGDFRDGASYGNAGYISPSHVIPLSAPGMISKGLRWMFNPESPFYIKLRPDPALLRWLWHFARHANEGHLLRTRQALSDLCVLSQVSYKDILAATGIEAGFRHDGLLMLYQTQKQADAEAADAAHARATGLQAEVLDADQVRAMDPSLEMDISGGVYYPGDAHLDPGLFMRGLREQLERDGVRLLGGSTVRRLVRQGGRLTAVESADGPIEADAFVLAAGAWSPLLSRDAGLTLPVEAARGYHINVPDPPVMPKYPFILTERKIAVTPMPGFLRFAGTLELAGQDTGINPRRIEGISKGLRIYLPQFRDLDISGLKPWSGLRPCSPDGLPYVGFAPGVDNLVVATGHAMLGMTMGAGTGLLVKQLLQGEEPAMGMAPLRVDRFG
jgi:D-amino-acid dehydrogenase